MPPKTEQEVQYKVVCPYGVPKDVTGPLAELRGRVGVKTAKPHKLEEGSYEFIVTIDSGFDAQIVIGRIRRMCAVWKTKYGFPATVEDCHTQGAEHD